MHARSFLSIFSDTPAGPWSVCCQHSPKPRERTPGPGSQRAGVSLCPFLGQALLSAPSWCCFPKLLEAGAPPSQASAAQQTHYRGDKVSPSSLGQKQLKGRDNIFPSSSPKLNTCNKVTSSKYLLNIFSEQFMFLTRSNVTCC